MSLLKNDNSKIHKCYHRPKGVQCDKEREYCIGCGWNPEIEAKRKEKLSGSSKKNNAN